MKVVKILAIVLGVYVLIVVAFESFIGYAQPESEGTIVIVTTDESGRQNDRVVTKLDVEGQIYVAANHWPRAWYEQALANPAIEVTMNGETAGYTAVPVRGDEHERVEAARPLPFVARFLMGFPPRYFVRLDPARET